MITRSPCLIYLRTIQNNLAGLLRTDTGTGMINYQEEIKHFKPSLDVDNIEDAIAGMNLTDMNDLMMQLVKNASTPAARETDRTPEQPVSRMQDNADDGYVNEG